ncbi:hypothetical protein [Rhizobium leguminosarum]|uniref:hypothetical protein n=1 Tax=Rhizobium leguminosarum TaxID=384 RepID=UPI0010301F93|nr:hypothetical protein [Rhizobium leguminosarum]TAX38965.1 hypothetical protein ELI05_08350 [Rhizobium leguminosarum]
MTGLTEGFLRYPVEDPEAYFGLSRELENTTAAELAKSLLRSFTSSDLSLLQLLGMRIGISRDHFWIGREILDDRERFRMDLMEDPPTKLAGKINVVVWFDVTGTSGRYSIYKKKKVGAGFEFVLSRSGFINKNDVNELADEIGLTLSSSTVQERL